MKRDMNLVHIILGAIEVFEHPPKASELALHGREPSQIAYHIKLLCEGGFLRGIDTSTKDDFEMLDMELTWQGHQLLHDIRSEEIVEKV